MMNQNQTPTATDTQEPQSGGIDQIIQTVQSYKQNPQSITPETLDGLLSDLMDLKSYIEGDSQEPQQESPMSQMIGGAQ